MDTVRQYSHYPGDGFLLEPKYVAIYVCFNKWLCIDGLFQYNAAK